MAGTVRPIDRRSVHQICSGQVVLNLATAVKELVENSLDAGATNIEIRLKDHGAESVEVIDNGSGVEDSNFQALTLKHHTSKLQDFSDLTTVDTFGFRGEALSSLCALSDLTILTCHKSAKVGTRLEYDHDGRITKQTHCPRQTGTTVSLQNLFSTLPVRHKEFQRNLKKEFAKMVHVLQGYCIISEGVKLACTNQGLKGGKSVVVATNGNSSLRENISSVFGTKQLQRLLEVTQVKPSEEIGSEFNLKTESLEAELFQISGFVSNPDHGQGRSSADRQYLFINRRPCDFPKVTKLINEVYHTYNRHQYPMCILDISLAKDSVDVNLTPDKRKVLVQEERLLLAVIKSSLVALFAPRASAYEMNQTLLSPLTAKQPQDTKRSFSSSEAPSKSSRSATLADLKRSFSNPGAIEDPDRTRREQQQPKLAKFISRFRGTPKRSAEQDSMSACDLDIKNRDHNDLLTPGRGDTECSENLKIEDIKPSELSAAGQSEHDMLNSQVISGNGENRTIDSDMPNTEPSVGPGLSPSCVTTVIPESVAMTTEGTSEKESSGYGSHDSMPMESSQEQSVSDGLEALSDEQTIVSSKRKPLSSPRTPSAGRMAKKMKINKTDEVEDVLPSIKKKEVLLPLSIAGLHKAAEKQQIEGENQPAQGIHFKAKIAPSDNTAAENELRKEISKDMFAKMEILGQFNLGFIIARLADDLFIIDQSYQFELRLGILGQFNLGFIIARLADDLFIIDQHATDEKYNFESLQKNTVLQGQRLIQPMPLELTAVNESILLDNVEIFNKNGFEFSVDLEAPPTKRVKLASLPVSRNWTFGKEDVDELIFMLSDAPGIHCRPSRVRQMFASRACRKSVMIGTALSMPDMRKLVLHMGEIEQPWNCPHGRPTMRHLFNLKLLPD